MQTKYWVAMFLAATLLCGVVRADEKSDEGIEAQLKAARQKLEEAADEVASLSAQLGRPLVHELMQMGEGPAHAVIGVQLESNSAKDGAHVRDVIVAVNGTDVKGEHSPAAVAHLVRNVEPNSKVKIHLLREGKPLDFEVTARPVETAWGMPGLPPHSQAPFEPFGPGFMGGMHGSVAGMELATLTPQLGAYFGTDKGVLVLRAPRSAAFSLQDGDVILSIDGREPTSGSHATRILSSYQPGEKVKLQVMRQHKKTTVDALVPERHRGPPPEPLAFVDGEEN